MKYDKIALFFCCALLALNFALFAQQPPEAAKIPVADKAADKAPAGSIKQLTKQLTRRRLMQKLERRKKRLKLQLRKRGSQRLQRPKPLPQKSLSI
ncbi:MAG: hypothetical protein HYY43_05295 [Deltaproteobacteria bacterium]|nr:hypothetical protein [Deltaproteobacteria bacterium]